MSLVENEQTKLLAAALNNTAVAIIITAVVAPLASFLYGAQTVRGDYWFGLLIIWFLVGIGIHLFGQVILRRLKP